MALVLRICPGAARDKPAMIFRENGAGPRSSPDAATMGRELMVAPHLVIDSGKRLMDGRRGTWFLVIMPKALRNS